MLRTKFNWFANLEVNRVRSIRFENLKTVNLVSPGKNIEPVIIVCLGKNLPVIIVTPPFMMGVH